jgi:hypothetical protein
MMSRSESERSGPIFETGILSIVIVNPKGSVFRDLKLLDVVDKCSYLAQRLGHPNDSYHAFPSNDMTL